MRLFLVLCVLLTSVGCIAVKESLSKYQACYDDIECRRQMDDVRKMSHIATESAVAASGVPTIPEAVAVLVSSVCAFAFGVSKGRKKEK